jgi:hypothetical protein
MCPTGKYSDQEGAISPDDCVFCPEGKFGEVEGLTTRECSGSCPAGKYSSQQGLNDDTFCVTCPVGYRGWQCNWEIEPRKGFFDSTTGHIDESAHAYLDRTGGKTGQEIGPTEHPDGEWSADRYAGEYSGKGTAAGAYPHNAHLYPGRPAEMNFNIAPLETAHVD